ncbi:PH domain-containing protein [Ornithinibacillus halotolerans]|uniref:Uncharacterized protein YyaB-like PH domain-containing protein n=1 Tax=Ornithinibacillus halotolerans TaxID=1274357 RepID=A0A916S4E0_9BACI|nr:PH domain-containing protein [Ornithinibacillus halotolerans]GGA80538.1 hypothetical protein GCM10008025_24950 [Ornithinibacillus halotolerans]
MYFPSKKDVLFFIIIWGSILATIFVAFYRIEVPSSVGSILGKIFLLLITVLLLWTWFNTGYTIKDSKLTIRSGPFKKKIKVEDITKITKVKHPLAAPALSIDRLEIMYSNYNLILISPKNEQELIDQLLTENPQIRIG